MRFTLRLFRSSVGFSLVAILSLALGIGASSAIFSLVYAVLIDPYPYRYSDRIVAPMFSDTRGEQGRIWYAIPDYLDLKRYSKTLEDAFLSDGLAMVATGGLAEPVRAVASSPNAFEFLGVPAMLGRNFGPVDIPAPETPPNIAVLSYLFWQRHFNGDPNIIGKTLELNHQPYSILGVAPPRFTWSDGDVYLPLPMLPGSRKPMALTARIRPGLSLDACSAEWQAMTERFAKQSPGVYPKEFRLRAKTLKEARLGNFRGTVLILMAAVAFLLLIACGNVSILLLARAGARHKEMALRLALGASRGRVVRQLLTESVLLALAGGLIGVFLAYRGVPALVALMPPYAIPHEAVIQVNGAVVLFSFAVSVLTGILFGMAPALQLAKHDVRDAMQESGRGLAGGVKTGKVRSLLIVGEVALTVILLVGAGIAVRGFVALTEARLGYDPSNVLMMYLNTREGAYKTWEARRIHYERILDKLKSTPGVVSATTAVSALPPRIGWDTQFEIAAWPKEPNQRTLVGLVAGDYFSTVRIPMLRGRSFSRAELQRPERVAVINEEMQRHYWPDGRDPIGLKILVPELKMQGSPYFFTPPAPDQWLQIIGVVATARNRGLQDPPRPAMYVPYTLVLGPACWYLVRTEGDPHRLIHALREQIRSVDPDTPVSQTMTLSEFLSRSERAYPRFSTTLFSIFAVVGLILAASGIYSVVSFVVTRRTHEFGIRMALGARATDVLRLVMGMTARLMLAGIGIGLLGSLALSRVIASYVQGWNAKDPIAFVGVTLILAAVALLACWFPTRRATTIQPMRALRHE